jgi:hypothetical protein
MNSGDQITTSWFAEIQVYSSNVKSLDQQLVLRGIAGHEHTVFRFTVLEIPAFYELYRLSHKWKGTKIVVNGSPVIPSPSVTKTFRCCYDASSWPTSQDEYFEKNGRPRKHLEVKHYCYGYSRTIFNIVGCQKIEAARDNRLPTGEQIAAMKDKLAFRNNREGWMNHKFILIKDGRFHVDLNALRSVIAQQATNVSMVCPFFVQERITHGLELLEQFTESAAEFWTLEEDGTVNPNPIEYYFDMSVDKRMGSKFIHQHSIVFFVLLSELLRLSLYETVLLIAIEHPSPGFTIGLDNFGDRKTYVHFETLKQLGRE